MTEKPGDIVSETELWGLHVRPDVTQPWFEFGTNNAECADILRTLDYRREHHPDEELRIVRTEVTVIVEDPERLREIIKQRSAQGEAPGLQSE